METNIENCYERYLSVGYVFYTAFTPAGDGESGKYLMGYLSTNNSRIVHDQETTEKCNYIKR